MKLKKKEDHNVAALVLLRKGIQILTGGKGSEGLGRKRGGGGVKGRQDHIDLRSSMTLYGIQGHQSYTKNSLKAWSISNACVGSKELCFFPLVDMLTCGTVSKEARWAVLLCGSCRLFWALFRNLLIGACWWWHSLLLGSYWCLSSLQISQETMKYPCRT